LYIRDTTQQIVYFQNSVVEAANSYKRSCEPIFV